jgi:DNA-binding beta-propeller fold protein YncE
MILCLALHALVNGFMLGGGALEAPAGLLPAKVVYGGTTVLPNGRFLTPTGLRWYTAENLFQVVLSPDGSRLAAFHSGGVTVFDARARAKPERRTSARRRVAPAGAFTPNGGKLLISLGDEGAIEVLSAETLETEARLAANVNGTTDSYVNDIVVSPDGRWAYAVDVANQDVLVFDLEAGSLVSRVRAGRQPYALCLDPGSRSLFVANIGIFDYSLIPKPREGAGSPRGISRPAFAFPSKEAKEGVVFEGRRVPGLGSEYVPDAQSVYRYSLRDPGKPVLANRVKAGLLIHAPADGGKAVGGSAPNALLLHQGLLYVSNANNDTVQVFRAADLSLVRTIRLSPSPLVWGLRGVIPAGMAINRAGTRLYVAEGGLNSVAVIDPRTGVTLGRIPTGWFPIQLRLSPDERTLYVGTQKGLGRGPRGPKHARTPNDERYGFPDMPGMVDVVPVPTDQKLVTLTRQVLVNNGLVARPLARAPRSLPLSPVPGVPSREIRHVVFITKENHTFDGIFGGLRGAKGEPEYAEFGMQGWIKERGREERVPIMPNHIRLAEQFAISENFYMEPQASGDGHRWLVGVYPSLWTTRVFYAGWSFRASNTAKGRLASFESNGSQIPEDYLENGSMWEHLERGGITFRNYGEGFEFPAQDEGPGTSRTGSFLIVNHPINRALWQNTCWEYPVYNTYIPDVARVEWFKRDLERNFRSKGKPIPRYLNITLCNDHGASPRPKDGYPYVASYMADNDLALGRLVEYLSHMPEWKNMAIFVTQDDPGADNDHVDRHRSYVLLISPYAKRGYISKVHTSIMSILKSIYHLFGLGPNNMFDALATDLGDLFTSRPDFTPYKCVPSDPRVFDPEKTISPDDPSFDALRKMAPEVRLDDPDFMEWLRGRYDTEQGGAAKPAGR